MVRSLILGLLLISSASAFAQPCEALPAKCEVDLQGREAFAAGEVVTLLVRFSPPSVGRRLVLTLEGGSLQDAVRVQNETRTWAALLADAPLALRYRAPRSGTDVLRVFGSCDAPTVPLPVSKAGEQLCEVALPALTRTGGVGIDGSWRHTWDYTDSSYRYVGSHEATITGVMPPTVEEGPVTLYASGLTVQWRWSSKMELLKPEPGCPTTYRESSGSGSFEPGNATQLQLIEVAKAAGPLAAAPLKGAGLGDSYAFELGGPAAEVVRVPGTQMDGTSKEKCHSRHAIAVPVPYPAVSASSPTTSKPLRLEAKWSSSRRSDSLKISEGEEPGRLRLKPASDGGKMHFYSFSLDVKLGAGKAADR